MRLPNSSAMIGTLLPGAAQPKLSACRIRCTRSKPRLLLYLRIPIQQLSNITAVHHRFRHFLAVARRQRSEQPGRAAQTVCSRMKAAHPRRKLRSGIASEWSKPSPKLSEDEPGISLADFSSVATSGSATSSPRFAKHRIARIRKRRQVRSSTECWRQGPDRGISMELSGRKKATQNLAIGRSCGGLTTKALTLPSSGFTRRRRHIPLTSEDQQPHENATVHRSTGSEPNVLDRGASKSCKIADQTETSLCKPASV
ncbi:hypothetical protein ABIA24_004496 [Sinorhizobium fredii]